MRPLSWGPPARVTNAREVLGLRLWLVSHDVITSRSPTEQFEICGSGTRFRGIWFPEWGGHVPDRHNSPFWRGRRHGGPEPGGRARRSVAGGPGRLAGGLRSVGPGSCPGYRQRRPPRIVRTLTPGARASAPSPCGGHGGEVPGGRPRVQGGPAFRALSANRGAPSMAPPPSPPGGLSCGPPPVESRSGGGARGAVLRGLVGGPLPVPGGS